MLEDRSYGIIFIYSKMIWFDGVPFSFSLLHDCYFLCLFFIAATSISLAKGFHNQRKYDQLSENGVMSQFLYLYACLSICLMWISIMNDRTMEHFFPHSPHISIYTLLIVFGFFLFVLLNTRLFNGTLSSLLSQQSTHAFA